MSQENTGHEPKQAKQIIVSQLGEKLFHVNPLYNMNLGSSTILMFFTLILW